VQRLVAAGADQQAALQDGDAGERRDLRPHIPRAAGAAPGEAGRLAGDRDKTEIAHRGAGRARVAVHHGRAQAMPRSGQRMRQADDASPYDQAVEASLHGGY